MPRKGRSYNLDRQVSMSHSAMDWFEELSPTKPLPRAPTPRSGSTGQEIEPWSSIARRPIKAGTEAVWQRVAIEIPPLGLIRVRNSSEHGGKTPHPGGIAVDLDVSVIQALRDPGD
jgi:hypothetical protein